MRHQYLLKGTRRSTWIYRLGRSAVGGRRRWLRLELFRCQSCEHDVDAFNHGKENAAYDGGSQHSWCSVPDRQDGASDSPRDDRVPGVLLLPKVDQRTINGTECPSPDSKVAACDWCSRFNPSHHSSQSPTHTRRRISEPFDAMKDGPPDGPHRKSAPTIINDPPRAWFSGIFLHIVLQSN
jgi:hypothetical protein